MGEPWLRGEEGAWLPSPQSQGVHSLTISDILLPNTKGWDKEKIMSLFPLHIANRILETPLNNLIEEDRLIWNDDPHDNYKVRSGYKLLLHDAGKIDGEDQREDWYSLWKIQAPPKAKHLLWRICRGCLPTRVRLQEKHVSCPLSCPICDQAHEDDWHVIFGCSCSNQARQAAGPEQTISKYLQETCTAREAVLAIVSSESKEIAGAFAVLVWSLWQNRNNKVWNEEHLEGINVGIQAQYQWEEWQAIHHAQAAAVPMQQAHINQWLKPHQGWYKCNVDAAFHRDLNKTSIGWCLRDHLGRFVMAETTWVEGIYSIIEGEALALKEAILSMEQRRFSHVVFETDSKSVVDAI